MRKIVILILAFTVGVFLSGCGGGGGTSPANGTFSRVLGVGVIMKSRALLAESSISGQPAEASWKVINLAPGFRSVLPDHPFQAVAINWEETPSLILLVWDKVAGAGRYQVFYQGVKVWDSKYVDTLADGDFQLDNPQAYLDFDQELQNPAAGQYQFTIMALKGETVIATSPVVTASFGVYLQSLPDIKFDIPPNLTWSKIDNATEYRITVKGVGTARVDSDATLSYNINQILGTATGSFDVYVDARVLDSNGNPVEISRGFYTVTK